MCNINGFNKLILCNFSHYFLCICATSRLQTTKRHFYLLKIYIQIAYCSLKTSRKLVFLFISVFWSFPVFSELHQRIFFLLPSFLDITKFFIENRRKLSLSLLFEKLYKLKTHYYQHCISFLKRDDVFHVTKRTFLWKFQMGITQTNFEI